MAGTRLRSAPKIRLVGLWLEEAGFRIGESVQVEVSHGRLVLTPAEKTDGTRTR
jgi:antitoxin component of MazEF toxin-antitoxin module